MDKIKTSRLADSPWPVGSHQVCLVSSENRLVGFVAYPDPKVNINKESWFWFAIFLRPSPNKLSLLSCDENIFPGNISKLSQLLQLSYTSLIESGLSE